MKKIHILLSALILLSFSCRKIIDIELDDADKRTAIDAKLVSGTHDFRVKVTKSGNFFGENTVADITNATVVLTDENGSTTLTNIGDGYYELQGYQAIANKTYSLSVTEGGTVYEATTTMPRIVEIDTISYIYEPASAFGDEGYRIYLEADDPAGIDNYYRIELEFGGERYGTVEDLTLLDDQFTDGNPIVFPIFNADVAELGDTVTMYLFSLDKQSYDYFLAIDELLFGDAATPANPKSNWNNNALGNFSGMAADTMTVIITP